MSIISRRQRDLLLNDVSRMINNNIHSAFANHAKIAECISNGDLKLYIDAPKKELTLKYGNKNIRFTINEQMINELNGIMFCNKSILKGISDSSLIGSSNIALSTKWGNDLTAKLNNHNHDSKYAKIDHNHDSQYANINHTHPDYQPSGNYAPASHTHSQYDTIKDIDDKLKGKSNTNHTHWDLPSDRDDFEEEIKTIVEGSKAWRVIKGIFKGCEVVSDVVQYGLIAGMQGQITAIYTTLAANGIVDAAQTTTTLGTALIGYADKIKDVGDFVNNIGKSFDTVGETCKKIAEPIQKASETVGKYGRIVDNFMNCDGLQGMKDMVSRGANGADISQIPLPRATDVLNMNLI